MGRKAKDLTGFRSGKLTVLEKYGPKPNDKHIYWWCQCDCGNKILVRGNHLTDKTRPQTSCGCGLKKDLIGLKFGKLTVIKLGEKSSSGRIRWECKCECGNVVTVQSNHLVEGTISSCGCILSRGEEKVSKILQELNIDYETQFFKKEWKLSSGFNPRYDFAIFNKQKEIIGLIEYNGIQHYEYLENTNGWNNKDNFINTIKRDKEKELISQRENIPLLIIPYTKINEIKEIVINFYNSINKAG